MPSPSQHLGYWVKRTYLLSAQLLDAHLQDFGLGRTQWQIMYHLAHDGPTGQRHLQKLLQVESATLTNLVASLVRKGWVVQSPDPSDGRSKRIEFTPAGKKVWESLPDPLQAVQAKMLQDIAPTDVEHTRRVLKKIVENLEKD